MKYIFFILILFLSCKKDIVAEQTSTNEPKYIELSALQFKANNMQFGTLAMQNFETFIQVNGQINVPQKNQAKIASPFSGTVKQLYGQKGDYVSQGQTLVVIESEGLLDLQKEFAEVGQKLNNLKKDYERQKTLNDEKITSEKNFLKAESDYKSQQAVYQNLKRKIEIYIGQTSQIANNKFQTTLAIKAPFSGYISQIETNVGAYVNASDVLLEVINPEQMQLALKIFEKNMTKVAVNQKVIFHLDEDKKNFQSKISRIDKVIDPIDRTITAYGNLSENDKKQLITGMFVNAKIISGQKNVLALPAEAVLFEDDKPFVLVDVSKTANQYLLKKIFVELGDKNEEFIEIIPSNKLNEKTKILIKGGFMLVE